jgi:DNA repair protein RecO (recombination protein O)
VRSLTTDAFILGTHALRERDRIVSFLTRDAGKKRGVARGARNPRSSFSGALEPMTEVRIVYFEKEGRDLVSIDETAPIRSSFALSRDLPRALLFSSLAESLEVFVSDSDPAEPFYRLARHAIDSLVEGASTEAVGAYFDVWILKLSGLFPSASECAGCGKALPAEGSLLFDQGRPGFIGTECRRGEAIRFSREARSTLRLFLASPLDPAADPEGLAEIAAVTRLARRHFLGHELKSRRVIGEVLG